jgi:hypothetical protein
MAGVEQGGCHVSAENESAARAEQPTAANYPRLNPS